MEDKVVTLRFTREATNLLLTALAGAAYRSPEGAKERFRTIFDDIYRQLWAAGVLKEDS